MERKKKVEKLYLLLCNSNGGGPAFAPCPCDVHKRPILVETGVEFAAAEVDGFLIVAVDDGGLMPVGFGKRDDAVDTSLLIDFSDGDGDGARSAFPSDDCSGFVSLILFYIFYSRFYRTNLFYSLD